MMSKGTIACIEQSESSEAYTASSSRSLLLSPALALDLYRRHTPVDYDSSTAATSDLRTCQTTIGHAAHNFPQRDGNCSDSLGLTWLGLAWFGLCFGGPADAPQTGAATQFTVSIVNHKALTRTDAKRIAALGLKSGLCRCLMIVFPSVPVPKNGMGM